MTEWRKIKGYEEYEVSNLGEVRRDGKVLTPCNIKRGCDYYRLKLYKDGMSKSIQIHRLVAQAFLPNPDNKTTVNHKDHNGLNNSLDNLEWATASEQKLHSPNPVGLSGHRFISQRCGSWRVRVERGDINYRETFPTLQEAIQGRDDYLKSQRPS